VVPTAIPEPTTAPEVTTAPIASTGIEAVINVADHSNLSQILVDGEGMTLYMFTKDEPDKSNCSGKCLENWPPLLTQGNPVLGEGVDAAMIGTATLEDGSMIVTYNHMPLYYWIDDKAPGDATGQGNNDVWYVVAPDGNAIGMDTMINVAEDPNLGQILVDGEGMTLYMFTKDEPDKSNCSGKCLENWPPLLTRGNPVLGEGVDAAMIGTATLEDGSMIVTYNHMPLYYWIDDKAPGDATGQGNNDVWYVVAPDGNPVGFTNTNANDNGSSSSDNENMNSNSNQNSNDNSDNDNNGGGDDDGNYNGGG
jgi:predicted lipoprotein with Yx(FWY)xxD motif